MRTQTINSIQVTYPEATVWLGDKTYIEIDAPSYMKAGADITVRQEATGEERRLRHISGLNHIVFSLDDTLQSLNKYGVRTYTVMVTLLDEIFTEGVMSFAFDLYEGKSLPNRSHGAARTFYVYDDEDLQKFQLFTLASGSVTVGSSSYVAGDGYNAFDLRSVVLGDTEICYTSGAKDSKAPYGGGGYEGVTTDNGVLITGVVPSVTSAVAQLSFSDTSGEVPEYEKNGGDIWPSTKTSNEHWCGTIYRPEYCWDYDTFKVKYLDADGLERVLMGRVTEETTQSGGEWYRSPLEDGIYRNISRRHITSSKKTCKVGFPDVAKDAYFSDIVLSPRVWFRNYSGGWTECSLEDAKVTVNANDTQDYVITFKILES